MLHPAIYKHPSKPIETPKLTAFGRTALSSVGTVADARPGEYIAVFAYRCSAPVATTITPGSKPNLGSATAADLTTYIAAEGGASWGDPEGQMPMFRTKNGEALVVTTGSGGLVDWHFTYCYVK